MTDEQPVETGEADDLDEYTVTIGGIEHTMLLDEAHAESYGDAAKKGGSSNKSRSAANKAKA